MAIYRSININRKHTSNILYYLSLSPPHPHDFTGRTLVIANIFSWQYNQIDDIRINDELMGQCFLCWDTNTYLSEGQEWIQREVEKWAMPPYPDLVSPLVQPVLCFQRSLLTSKNHKNHISEPLCLLLSGWGISGDQRTEVEWDEMFILSTHLVPTCIIHLRFQLHPETLTVSFSLDSNNCFLPWTLLKPCTLP